jgi:hypothetical protein
MLSDSHQAFVPPSFTEGASQQNGAHNPGIAVSRFQRSTFIQLLDFRLDFLQKVSVQSQLHLASGTLEDEALDQEVHLKFILAAA